MNARILQTFKATPLLGSIFDARLRDHKEAAGELLLSAILSSVPIWLGSLILQSIDSTGRSVYDHAIDTIRGGELFLLSTSFVAPLFYFILKDHQKGGQFPHQSSLISLSSLIILVCGAFFAIIRAGGINASGLKLNIDFIFSASVYIFFIAVIITYLAHVYKNLHESGAVHKLRSDTHDFVNRFTQDER